MMGAMDTPDPMPAARPLSERVRVDQTTGKVNVDLTPAEVLAHVPNEVLEMAMAKAQSEALGQVLLAHARGAVAAPADPEADTAEEYAQRLIAAPKKALYRALIDAGHDASMSWTRKRLAQQCEDLHLEPAPPEQEPG